MKANKAVKQICQLKFKLSKENSEEFSMIDNINETRELKIGKQFHAWI